MFTSGCMKVMVYTVNTSLTWYVEMTTQNKTYTFIFLMTIKKSQHDVYIYKCTHILFYGFLTGNQV